MLERGPPMNQIVRVASEQLDELRSGVRCTQLYVTHHHRMGPCKNVWVFTLASEPYWAEKMLCIDILDDDCYGKPKRYALRDIVSNETQLRQLIIAA
jgi:hypothetical protein